MKKSDYVVDADIQQVSLSWFLVTLRKHYPIFAELVFISICLRLLGLFEPFIYQVVIDRVLPFQREATLVVIVAVFAILGIFQMGFSVLLTLLDTLTLNHVTREYGQRVFKHLFHLPIGHFRKWQVGELIARIGETHTISGFIVGTTIGIFLDVVFVIIYLFVLFSLSSKLTWIVVASIPVQFAIYFLFGPILRKKLKTHFDAKAMHQSLIVENVTGISAIKAVSAENKIREQLDGTLHKTLIESFKLSIVNLTSGQAIFIVNRAMNILILFVGASLLFEGDLTLGELFAFNLISEKISGPFANFSNLWESWQNVKISRQRLGDILCQVPEPFDRNIKLPANLTPSLTFRRVSFHYKEGAPVLAAFDLHILPYTLNVIVGPSGAGKSTLGRLAAGIDTPVEGAVLFGEKDISKYNPHDVRTTIAYVPQDPFLFSGSVRDNLLLGSSVASAKELEQALSRAAFLGDVRNLHQGLDTEVGERGSALSGGQRQRLAIARSLLTKPKVLILDEPTNALDEKNQLLLLEGIAELLPTTTIVIITHRPDLFSEGTRIIRMEPLSGQVDVE